MKQKLVLLFVALLSAVGAWAIDVKIANTSSGLPTAAGFGSFSGQVFTTAAGSGLAGVTVTAQSGVTIGEQYVNVANYGNCFRIVTAAANTNYKITLAVPEGYVITGYSLACSANTNSAAHTLTSEDGSVSVVASSPPYNSPTGPKPFEVTGLEAQSTYFTINTANKANTLFLPTFTIYVMREGGTIVNVTYALYESDGTTLLSQKIVQQEASSAVNIPTEFLNNTDYYTYTTEGTIGTEDCTVKVIRTLKDASIIYPYTGISNNKSYYLYTKNKNRGGLSTYTANGTTYLASPVKSALGISPKRFAIISYEENYYLYSVDDEKFVTYTDEQQAPLADYISGTSDRITFTQTVAPLYELKFNGENGKIFNSSASYTYGIVFNTWGSSSSQWDDGCQYSINEADAFDPTSALAALDAFFHPSTDVVLNLAVNVTGTTEADNTRLGKITMSLNNESVSKYLYADTEPQVLEGFAPVNFTATATSYRGYEFTGFTVGEVDYGTSIEAGELADVATGSTLVANYVASTGNGIALWDDYTDDNSAAYRIPALVRTQSGRLIAFSDYRPGHKDVGQGATSIERRYSDDGGVTWSPALCIAEGKWGVNTANVIEWSFGDAAVVADNTPGNSGNDVLMISCGGNMSWPSSVYNPDCSQNQQGCVRWRSTDGGVTWSDYEYIMPDIMQAFVDAGLRAADGSSGIVRAFFTSGKITQSVHKAEGALYNRIYSAVNIPDQNVVMYSDDFGETWKVLGNQIANSGDEAHVVELPDGDLLLVSRGGSSRWVNVFNYTDFNAATGQWGPTGQWNNAVATSCNGDVEVIEAYDAYGEKNTVVVETAPMYSSQRRDIQYYYIALPKAEGFSTTDFTTVGGASWTQGMNVTHNWSAYSALLGNGDGTLDILFEESAKGETKSPTGYSIVYQKGHTIQDITHSLYFFNKEQAEAEGVKTPRIGHFYRFKSTKSDACLTVVDGAVKVAEADEASTIWYYGPEGLVAYSMGLYLDCNARGFASVGTSYKAAIAPNSYYDGKYTIQTNSRYCYHRDSNGTIDRGSGYNNDEGYAWIVEDVTSLPVTVANLGLATLYSPVGLTAPEGVKVYAATQNETYIHFDEVEAVKAGTGVLVEAEPGTYDFTISSNEADYSSDLVGDVATVAKSSIAATVYTLQSGPAFKQYTGTNVTGFRSHIETETSEVKAFDIIFDQGTGLNGLKDLKDSKDLIFNLAGQRMSKVQKGINIINGKKVMK